MMKKPGTDELSGRVKIRLGSVNDAKVLEDTLQGTPVAIGGEWATVQVHNPVLHRLPTCTSGNDVECPSFTSGGVTL